MNDSSGKIHHVGIFELDGAHPFSKLLYSFDCELIDRSIPEGTKTNFKCILLTRVAIVDGEYSLAMMKKKGNKFWYLIIPSVRMQGMMGGLFFECNEFHSGMLEKNFNMDTAIYIQVVTDKPYRIDQVKSLMPGGSS